MKTKNKHSAKDRPDAPKHEASGSAVRRKARWLTWLLLALAVVLPGPIVWAWYALPPLGAPLAVRATPSTYPASKLAFRKEALVPAGKYWPRITNVQVVDLDADGLMDVLYCDGRRNGVYWRRQTSRGVYRERKLGGDLDIAPPAHATVVDLDKDGDVDVVVSVLGNVSPSDEHVGKVVWLENDGQFEFTTHLILDDERRVADAQPGDLDGDGDVDLVVAVFGYNHGRILWLEQRAAGRFVQHELLQAPGTIHVPIHDYDGDGDLDVVALVSQDYEEVWAFENTGGGAFEPKKRIISYTHNFDVGSSGLVKCDLDRDGDMDLLWTAGDNLEIFYHYPQPYHGCYWLENRGNWEFVKHRISDLGGTYAAAPSDLDGDGDTDVVLASMFNDWNVDGAANLVWLENDGKQNFTPWQIDGAPILLATVACGDLDGDGRDDVVAGGMNPFLPDPRMGEVTGWFSGQGGGK
ncbi:MAG: VCBS repeat-containing protein [Planctomycetia bacterium]|nr:VCBS repeat-containing protein [Planctomycetia bacterium]